MFKLFFFRRPYINPLTRLGRGTNKWLSINKLANWQFKYDKNLGYYPDEGDDDPNPQEMDE